ncbi:hypothetical protein NST38_10000 [Paenibacillus sp. FSL H8-0104]|uniref:hypothetical protein n=1 Tax=Paenibacillus sp. FSL H8-0104 TaxID=2954509 RepID=UPI0030FDD889
MTMIRPIKVPAGYAPATYEDLAHMTGLPVEEAKKGVSELEEAGIVSIIRLNGFMFYKLNL